MMTRKINPRISDDGELQDGKFCLYCGVINSPDADCCRKCGTAFHEITAPIPRRYARERNLLTFNSLIQYYAIRLGLLFGTGIVLLVTLYVAMKWASQPRLVGSPMPISVATIPMFVPTTSLPSTPVPLVPDQASVTEGEPVFKRTLPGEADDICLAKMPSTGVDIAASYKTSDNGQGVALISDDGTHLCRLTLVVGDQSVLDFDPQWFLGNQIVFGSTRDEDSTTHWQANFYMAAVTGYKIEYGQMSPDMLFSDPRWSPDGQNIAFISDDGFGDNYEVYVVNAVSATLHRLTSMGLVNWLAWSPDGKWIYFSGGTANGWKLYKISLDGSQPILLSPNISNDLKFALSPDGTSIAVISSLAQNSIELNVMNLDGSNRRKVNTGLALLSAAPAWLGTKIVFVANDSAGKFGLYKINLDGSGLQKLYQGPEEITSVAIRSPSIN